MGELRDDFLHLASHGIPTNEATAHRLSVALEGFLQSWKHETLTFVEATGSELRFLEAPYGRGKTHFLLLMARTARLAGFATAMVYCSSESKPFASIAQTYRSIIPALRFPSVEKPDGVTLFDFLGVLSQEQMQALRGSKRMNLGFQNLLAAYAQRARVEEPDSFMTSRLANLLQALPENPVRVSELYHYDHRLPRPLGKLSKRTAMPWLRGLLTMPQEVGLKGVVILFDETGADFHLGREERRVRREHFANLRNLIDHLGVGRLPGCAITYAVAGDLIEQARETLLPLAQRIERTLPEERNHRAVWCRLDELTSPGTDEPEFFVSLGQRITEMGREAGFPEDRLRKANDLVPTEARRMAASINNAAVREFIKLIASTITG